MTSFFNKLNTLVQAHLNDLIRPLGSADEEGERRDILSRRDIRKGLDSDLRVLKKRVQDALEHEAKLQRRVDKLYAEIAEWDAKADNYLRQGNEAQARYALGQLRRAQDDLASAEDALREHHIVTQALVNQVTQLEAVLEDARQREEALASAPPVSAPSQVEESPAPVQSSPRPAPEERLRKPSTTPATPSVAEPVASAPVASPKPASQAPQTDPVSSAPSAPSAPEEKRIKVKVEQENASGASSAVPVERKLPPNIQVVTPVPASSAPSSESLSPAEKRVKADPDVRKGETLARQIAERLDQTREKLGSLTAQYEQYVAEDKPSVIEEVAQEVKSADVEDDLARRRARLAKPEAGKDESGT